MSDTDRLLELSLILKAIDDCDQELTQFKAEHKARRENLQTQLNQLRWEVLSGQERLPLDAPQVSADSREAERMPAMGSLAHDSATEGAPAGKTQPASAESSNEEINREKRRKTKARLQGQDAILPDKRKPADASAEPEQPGAPA
jgi:hypothetical protein